MIRHVFIVVVAAYAVLLARGSTWLVICGFDGLLHAIRMKVKAFELTVKVEMIFVFLHFHLGFV